MLAQAGFLAGKRFQWQYSLRFRNSDFLSFQQLCSGFYSQGDLARSVLTTKPSAFAWQKADAFQ